MGRTPAAPPVRVAMDKTKTTYLQKISFINSNVYIRIYINIIYKLILKM